MDREVKEIITPIGGATVVLKSWITGREKREINRVLFDDSAMIDGKYSIDASKIEDMKDAALKNIIVSVNGMTENIIDILLDMRSEDYDFVVAAVDEVSSDKKSEESKKK